MKIAALADIHGNYQALITVLEHVERWDPDLVLVLGDTINRGSRSKDCLNLIQQKQIEESWLVIKGNHEEYVLEFDDPDVRHFVQQTQNELRNRDTSGSAETFASPCGTQICKCFSHKNH